MVMSLKQLRQEELEQQKRDRRNHIVFCALNVFEEQGIDQSTMNEIAEVAQVGIATIFRYFESKKQLVIEAAQLLWENEYHSLNKFLPEDFDQMNGLNQLQQILSIFKFYFQKRPEIFRFLEQFDNYVANEKIEISELEVYEHHVLALKDPILQAIDKGRNDKSIRTDFDETLFYLTITHQLMSLVSKLVLRGKILSSDLEVSGEAQIDVVLSMIIGYARSI
jgi:AcrR family transcriptional regulator